MLPANTAAASFVPSADEVIPRQFFVAPTEISSVQVAPLSPEVQILPPFAIAASFVPSAEDVIFLQACVAPTEVSSVQLAPLSVEVHILPPDTVAASFVPSSEEVIPFHPFDPSPTVISVHSPISISPQDSHAVPLKA